MQKTRIMPTLLYKDTTLVKGEGFDSWRRVGSLMQAVKVYNMREVDELVFLDITATEQRRGPDIALVDDFADDCFMPLCVGGGISTVEDVRNLLMAGADKIAINSAALKNPQIISDIAGKFGAQCVVISIDYKLENGKQMVYSHSGKEPTGKEALEWAKEAVALGAGEILLTSIERDGCMTGYDTAFIRQVSEAVDVPVIASGGAGNYEHMFEALDQGKASAIAAASIFHFTEQTPLEAKRYLKEKGIHVRI